MSTNIPNFVEPKYGISRTLVGVAYADAVPRITEALKKEGFGVLTEIDVKATLKKKLDVEVRPYVILGACNPALAFKALSAEPGVGLLLPCNVVVTQDDQGNAVLSAVDPVAMLGIVNRSDVLPVANEARAKLERAVRSA